jgi:hypothetical protein
VVAVNADIYWSAVREWLIALGTISATAAAVYIGVIREHLQRPRLSLSFDWGRAEDAQLSGDSDGIQAAYARLRAANASGRRMAERVELRVLRIIILEPVPTGKVQPSQLADFALAVSLSEPTSSELDIAPGAERHIDFVHVKQGETEMSFDVWPLPSDGRNRFDPGLVQVDLSLTAANADAQLFRIRVSWDGVFSARSWEEIWQHLRIEPPVRL